MCLRQDCNAGGLLWVFLDIVSEVGATQLYCDVLVSSIVQSCLYRLGRKRRGGEGRGGEDRGGGKKA